MKLFSKYNRINIIASILIFLGGCLAFYFVMDYVLIKQLDEALETEESEIVQYVQSHNSLPEIVNTNDQQTYFVEVAEPFSKTIYHSKKLWNKSEQESEWMRQLIFGITVSNRHYQITVNKSQEETKGFLQLIVLIAATMIALILIAGYIINRVVLKRLWQPFYNSIHSISNYQLQQQAIQLPSTPIEEFNLLNHTINQMTARVEKDYQTLKAFTGNAAHEMQTPLAVISTNTESLMQDETVLKLHHTTISTIEEAAKRLSRLNQSLLLLTKIENRRFDLTEKIQWDELIQKRASELNELMVSQNIHLSIDTVPVTAVFHQHLADIIVSNLLGNAIRYNYQSGSIDIQLNKSAFTISNTSTLPSLDETRIFNRFYRHPETKVDGNGLGLSIVQQVCHAAGYTISYQYNNNRHIFTIHF